MIRVSNVKFETPITLESDSPFVVYVENPSEFFVLYKTFAVLSTEAKANFRFGKKTPRFRLKRRGKSY